MKTFFTLCIVYLILPFCYGQDHNDFKTLKNYTLILRADTLIGKYIGEVDRLNVDGNKQNTPTGFGYFIGETKKKEKYVVCKGNWFSGSLYGKNQISFFSNDYYPNLLIDSLDNPKRMTSKKEIWSSLNLDSLIIESFSGNFLMNVLESGTGIIKDPKYYYQGEILKWLPHGKGAITFKNDSIKLAGEYFKSTSFEGDFFFGNPAIGTMNFSNNTFLDLIQSMTGNWKEKLFTGNGKVHFSNGTIYEGHWKKGSLEGKGKYNRYDGWEFIGDFNDNQLNKSGSILSPNFQYIGNISNWIPNGTGIMTFLNDTIYLNDTPFINPKFEGEFFLGAIGNGKMFFDRNLNSNKLETQSLVGDWRNKSYSGNGKVNFTDSTFYEGEWLNGKEHGKGRAIKNDIVVISSIPMNIREYEGVFTKGKFENGVIRLLGGDELKGDLKDGIFTGEAKLTFTNNLSISLADALFQVASYNGKINNNTFERGQITFKSGEALTGDWKNNLFTGKGKLNVEGKYSYEGDWVNGLIQGNGKKVINDTLSIASTSILVKEYEGFFTNGKFEKGTIRSESNGELKGILNDGNFSGEGKITFQKSLAISLAKNSFEAVSYSGKIIDSKFDIGQMKLKSGETLTGAWKNNLFSGSGKLNIGDKYSYDGDWIEGDLHGKGKITKNKEWLYTGSFNKNQIDGSGELMYFSGNTYVSNFQCKLKEDEIDIRLNNNEKLKIIALNDLILECSIIDNTLIGFGEVELDNKVVYKGSFSMSFDAERIDEKLYSDELEFTTVTSGEGRLSYSNKDTLHVRWDKDGYVGKGRLNFGITENGDSLYEEGTFRNGLLDGQGKKCLLYKLYDYADQEYYLTYIGQFKGGSMYGKGVLYGDGIQGDVSLDGEWVNNIFMKGTMVEEYIVSDEDRTVETYTGEFLNNQRNGQGVLKSDEGTYTGTFVDGFPHGNGKYVYADGRIYEGEMKDGVPNGVGKMTLKNKQVLNGKFEDGEYQKPFSCKEVKIGDQIWMAENLNVSKFRNGDIIPEAKTKSDWIRASENETPAWSYYNFDEKNGQVYGKLYNWFAVDDSRGLAPEGWHVSSEKEWLTLLEKITPESEMLGSDHFGNAGTKLKSGMLWTLDEFDVKGKDQYGFKAIPGGWVINFINYSDRTSSNFYDINKKASFWTSTGNTFYDNVTRKNLPYWNAACIEITVYESIFPTDEFKINGLSVRCIRD